MLADNDLLEELYRFVRARATERVALAEKSRDRDRIKRAMSELRFLQSTYADVKAINLWAGSEAVNLYRHRAARDAGHPDYQTIWALPPK